MFSLTLDSSDSNYDLIDKHDHHDASCVRRRAVHHAAHAVVGHILGVPFEHVALTCTDDDHINVDHASTLVLETGVDFATRWRRARHVAMFLLAGNIAEWHVHQDEAVRVNVDSAETGSGLVMIANDPIATLLEIAEATSELVSKNWSCVELVAHALVERRRLTPADVAELIEHVVVEDDVVTAEGGSDAN